MNAPEHLPADLEELIRRTVPCDCGAAELGHLVVPDDRPSLLMLEHLVAARRLFPADAAKADGAQRGGYACVACSRDFLATGEPGMPVGGDLYACRSCVLAYACGHADAAYTRGPLRHVLHGLAVVFAGLAVRLRYWRA